MNDSRAVVSVEGYAGTPYLSTGAAGRKTCQFSADQAR